MRGACKRKHLYNKAHATTLMRSPTLSMQPNWTAQPCCCSFAVQVLLSMTGNGVRTVLMQLAARPLSVTMPSALTWPSLRSTAVLRTHMIVRASVGALHSISRALLLHLASLELPGSWLHQHGTGHAQLQACMPRQCSRLVRAAATSVAASSARPCRGTSSQSRSEKDNSKRQNRLALPTGSWPLSGTWPGATRPFCCAARPPARPAARAAADLPASLLRAPPAEGRQVRG